MHNRSVGRSLSKEGDRIKTMTKLSNTVIRRLPAAAFLIAAMLTINAAAQSTGGNYILKQPTISSGGSTGTGASTSGPYSIESTMGQSVAGTNQQQSSFTVKPGFWTAQALVPTAAGVSVSGRVVTAGGAGIRNVIIRLVSTSGGSRTAISSSLGYFRFDDVASGETCILTVSAKRHAFAQGSIALSVFDAIDDVIFIADEAGPQLFR